jgi:hypothetical protein
MENEIFWDISVKHVSGKYYFTRKRKTFLKIVEKKINKKYVPVR